MIDKEELLQIAREHKHVDKAWVRLLDLEACKEILKEEGRTFAEKLYRFCTGNYGKCKLCGKQCVFLGVQKGYKEYCGSKCSLSSKGITSSFQLPGVREKIRKRREEGCYRDAIKHREETCCQRYGEDYAKMISAKGRQTKLERYGTLDPGKEKRKETIIERYGEKGRSLKQQEATKRLVKEHGFGSEQYKEWLKSRGVSNISQLQEVKDFKKVKRSKRDYKVLCELVEGKLKPLFTEEEFAGYYKNVYKFKCLRCNTEFEYSNVQSQYVRCPCCYPKRDYTSYAQQEITSFLQDLGVEVQCNVRKILGHNLELDIYLPEYKIAIEYDGLFWHGEFGGNKGSEYHLRKTELCNSKGIRLIHIFEDEWLFRQETVKSRLRYALGLEKKRYSARKCTVREISAKNSSDFLEKYHLQGEDRASIRIGAFFQGELVAVMTFGKLRISLGQKSEEGSFELVRFCTNRSNIPGIVGKLLKYFITKYKPKKIISYADRRWCNVEGKTVYERLGFKRVSTGTPNYWYFQNGGQKRYHRFSFRKNSLQTRLESYKPELTEWENMRLAGYDRIWDCGSYKFELTV